ncbi:prephenate dehydrogenase [Lachnospiraceae bacterium OttesenSCG-928-E19]|nr:prephenate dehydrogenase [Lachnospiraceae bacterium OttesenSCG-928-E19]
MKVGIIGLGLIGGSMAKAVKFNTGNEVLGWDISEPICYRAKLVGAVDDFLLEGHPGDCDIVIVALYPKEALEYILEHKADFKKGAIVVDCCGIKTQICETVGPIAHEYGFSFVGGHPMAGIERSGFAFSNPDIFQGATMILTPEKGESLPMMGDLSFFFRSLGFGNLKITTWQEHDQMIAYTSQLAHVVSSAYIKNDLSHKYKGFSAGSFQDMTRVAKLNENMWTELFMKNREYLAEEVKQLMGRLELYLDAIENVDEETMKKLLREGREKRQAIEEEPEFE